MIPDYLMGAGWIALCIALIVYGAAIAFRRPGVKDVDAVGLLREAATYFEEEPGDEADAIRVRLRAMADQLEGK